MRNHKKLLILDDSSLFFDAIGSRLHLFLPRFEITLLITEAFLSESKIKILDQLVSDRIVKGYYLIYDGGNNVRLFRKLKLIENELKDLNFDIFLTRESIFLHTRYLNEFILPAKCLRVLYWDKITVAIVDNLRYLSSNSKINKLIQDFSKRKNISISLKRKVAKKPISRSFNKVGGSFKEVGLFATLFKIYINISNNLKAKAWKRFRYFYDRILIPWFLLGGDMKLREHEMETQCTTGNVDLLLFTDTFEKKVHEVLYSDKSVKVDVVRNILEGQCDCHGVDNKSRTILTPLSGILNEDSIPKKDLDNYLKGLKIALEESGATCVHLRVHPQETRNWPYQLCDYLNENNVQAKLVDSSKPIPDIICSYMGVVGLSSNVLRDARAACDYAFIVCLEELSEMRFLNPKIVFGEGDGIEWINSDGSYNKSSFLRKKFHRPTSATLTEKLNDLSDRE
ncbi:hypothetical protein OAN85_02320 [Candidatus Pseudothioglobus singularis]|nr:hypothetical protein [Candidatus Pseudothioglobus singularis]